MAKRTLLSILCVLVTGAASLVPSVALAEPADCGDAIDNDGDGRTDFPDDLGCEDHADNDEVDPQCSDRTDNDGDGHTDYPNDPDCSSKADTDETYRGPQCSDTEDNDGDGVTDYPNDPDCGSPEDNSETDISSPPVDHLLTIRYDRSGPTDRFRGRLHTSSRVCRVDRLIRVKKLRPGRDRVIGRDRTNHEGLWNVSRQDARGRYYAVAPRRVRTTARGAEVACRRARSVTIRIPG